MNIKAYASICGNAEYTDKDTSRSHQKCKVTTYGYVTGPKKIRLHIVNYCDIGGKQTHLQNKTRKRMGFSLIVFLF